MCCPSLLVFGKPMCWQTLCVWWVVWEQAKGERLKGNEMQRYQKEELGQRASRWRELSRPTRFFQVDALVVGMIGNAIKRLPHSVVFFGEREGLDGGVYFEKQGLGAFVHWSCGSCSDGKVRGQMSARTTHSTFTQQQLTSRHMVQTVAVVCTRQENWILGDGAYFSPAPCIWQSLVRAVCMRSTGLLISGR